MEAHALLELVGLIYEAALDPARWDELFAQLVHATGAERGTLGLSVAGTQRSDFTLSHEMDADVVARWVAEFGARDPFYQRFGLRPAGTVLHGATVLPAPEVEERELYEAIMRPLGIRDLLTVGLARGADGTGFLSVYRGHGREPFSEAAVARMRAIGPHLVRAVTISARLAALSQRQQAGEAALALLPFGVASLDVAGRILALNAEAERIVAAKDGLRTRDHQLHATRTDDDRALRDAIESAAATARHAAATGASLLAIRRPSRGRPYQCLVAPVTRRSSDALFGVAAKPVAVLVVLADPELAPEPATDLLQRLFGLTPALARMAAGIASGMTIAEYAAHAGVTIETARFQMKQLLARTGARRQAELVRLLLTGIAQLRV